MKRTESARLAMLLASACGATMALCAPAWAQTAPGASATDDEAIVVTARRREENLQDVPISVSVKTGDQLDQLGAQNITALQEQTPNLTLQVARGSNSTIIGFIRGVGQQDPLWGFEPGVGLYVDDVYIARPQAAVLDIFNVQRIEVLRGPQGTLYGRNTIGGAIKYVTEPLATDAGHLTARGAFGSYNQRDFVVSGSIPLTDRLAVGGAIASLTRDGFGENLTTGAEHYDKNVLAFRLSADWNPTDDLSIRFSHDRVIDDSAPKHGHREAPNGALANYAVLPDPYDTRAGIGDHNHVQTTGYSVTAQWDTSETLTFKSITAFREGNTDTLIDFDGTPDPTLDVPAWYGDQQFTQEFQALFNMGRLQGVAGVYYLNGVAAGAFDTGVGAINTTIYTTGKVDTQSIAAFTDLSFDITDQWAVSVGARWTRDERKGTVYRQNYTGIRSPFFGNAAAVPGLIRSNYTNELTFEEVTPRFSITYEPSDDLTLYASYGRGYKSGGFDMRGDVVLTPATVNGYDPEFVNAYEVGFHASMFQNRARISGDVFYSDYQDVQITRQEPAPGGTIASFVDNAAAATIKGVELEGTVFLTDHLNSVFSLGYVDGGYDEYHSNTVVANPAPPPATIVVPVDLSNITDIQNTPDWTASLAFNYTLPVYQGDLVFTPSMSYRSSYRMFETATPLLDEDGYTLVNMDLTWTRDDGRLKFGLHGANLTDELYHVGGYNFPGATFGNSIIAFYGPPRTVTATVEVRF